MCFLNKNLIFVGGCGSNIYQSTPILDVYLHYRHAHGRSVCMLVDNSRPVRIRTTYTVIVYVFTYTFLYIRFIYMSYTYAPCALYIHLIYILFIRSIYTFYAYIFLPILTLRPSISLAPILPTLSISTNNPIKATLYTYLLTLLSC